MFPRDSQPTRFSRTAIKNYFRFLQPEQKTQHFYKFVRKYRDKIPRIQAWLQHAYDTKNINLVKRVFRLTRELTEEMEFMSGYLFKSVSFRSSPHPLHQPPKSAKTKPYPETKTRRVFDTRQAAATWTQNKRQSKCARFKNEQEFVDFFRVRHDQYMKILDQMEQDLLSGRFNSKQVIEQRDQNRRNFRAFLNLIHTCAIERNFYNPALDGIENYKP